MGHVLRLPERFRPGECDAGVELLGDTDSSGDHDSKTYFQIMPPQLGVVFYF
jgi:hypothetical protein